MSETTNLEVVQATETPVKPYIFRPLESDDVFTMVNIISKIGVDEFAACLEKASFKNLISSIVEQGGENVTASAGASAVLEFANVICKNLPKCRNDIYQLLSDTSNLTVEGVRRLNAVVFIEMVVDFFKKEEFPDFIKVVSKLFK